MPIEIERKFLVADESWRAAVVRSRHYRQGYFPGQRSASVRIRVSGEQAFLNIKSATLDVTRQEYEYAVPRDEAEEMLDTLCERPLIEKTRFDVPYAGRTWEIDVFEGENQGLVVAEVELEAADAPLALPPWAGEEVSTDVRYYNSSLVKHPFKDW